MTEVAGLAKETKSPQEEIQDFADSLIDSVDAIVEERGWPKSMDWMHFYGRFHSGDEGKRIKEAREYGRIARTHPQTPDALVINLRALKDFVDQSRSESYTRQANELLVDLLRKIGFLRVDEDLNTQSPRIAEHRHLSVEQLERSGRFDNPGSDWTKGTLLEHNTFNYKEIHHPSLPFVMDVMDRTDSETNFVYLRYSPKPFKS